MPKPTFELDCPHYALWPSVYIDAVAKQLAESLEIFKAIVAGVQKVSALKSKYFRKGFCSKGRMTRGDNTHRWLVAKNPPRWKKLLRGKEDGSEDYLNIEAAHHPEPFKGKVSHAFRTDWLQTYITGIGADYERTYRKGETSRALLTINDASVKSAIPLPTRSGRTAPMRPVCASICR